MLGLVVSFIIGIMAGAIIMCIYNINAVNRYEDILDDMAECLVGMSIWTGEKDIVVFNTKDQVKKYFIRGE